MAEPLPFGEVELASPLGTVAGGEDAGGILQGRRSQARVPVVLRGHE
jgi:hypothetical protein